MKKVVLLGDSIRLIGYGKRVPELLGEEYDVWQFDDNNRYAFYTLRNVCDYCDKVADCDVIHWNNGLWDTQDILGDGSFTPPDIYVATMKRLAGVLLQRSKKVIFATTTPSARENPINRIETIKRFNDLVVPELEAMGVIINDLYTTVYEHLDEYICEDMLHLSPAGIEACAAQVAESIRKAASDLD